MIMQPKSIEKFIQYPKSVLTIRDLMGILNLKRMSAIVQASRLVKQGVLISAGRNRFIVAIKPIDWLAVAVAMYAPSYISFETALNYYGIIDQIPQPIYLCTSRRTLTVEIASREFVYRTLAGSLYFGFSRQANTIMAEPEKAVLDQLYFNRRGLVSFHPDEMKLDKLDWKRLNEFSTYFPKSIQRKLAFLQK